MSVKLRGQIEQRTELAVEEFHSRYVRPGVPVVIKNALSNWPASKKWDPPYLKELLSTVPVKFKYSRRGLHPNFYESEMKEMFAVREATFPEYLALILEGPEEERRNYLFTGDEQFLYRVRDGKSELNQQLAPLWNDVLVPDCVPADRLYSVWSWFSSQGVKTWLHYDNNGCHNLNAQIRGKKRCLLFAPDQMERLSFFPPEGTNPAHNCSQVDIFAPDLARFPQIADAEVFEVEIEEGDLFFIPDEWSHAFEHQGEFNSNVNFWWRH
jgi:hypothetical protein